MIIWLVIAAIQLVNGIYINDIIFMGLGAVHLLLATFYYRIELSNRKTEN